MFFVWFQALRKPGWFTAYAVRRSERAFRRALTALSLSSAGVITDWSREPSFATLAEGPTGRLRTGWRPDASLLSTAAPAEVGFSWQACSSPPNLLVPHFPQVAQKTRGKPSQEEAMSVWPLANPASLPRKCRSPAGQGLPEIASLLATVRATRLQAEHCHRLSPWTQLCACPAPVSLREITSLGWPFLGPPWPLFCAFRVLARAATSRPAA